MLDKDLLCIKKRVKSYMKKEYDKDFSVLYIKENCMDEYKEKKKVANLLLSNVFLFNDLWDMEACSVPYKNQDLDWEFTPNGDEEWTFMLNRQEYLYKLVLCYYIENDIKYIDKVKELIFSWINNNKLSYDKTNTRRAIDTGIRCNSWINILKHLIGLDLLTDLELKTILNSIEEQFTYLRGIYKEKYVLSNWGVLQTTAILNGYMWFGELIASNDIGKWAREEFEKQMEIQIFDDGSQWEQSPMYHVEVLRCLQEYIYSCKVNNIAIDSKFIGLMNRMTDYIAYSMTPKGYFEAQCDSDRTNVTDILEKGCILSSNSFHKALVGDKLTINTIYMMGKFANEKICDIIIRESSFTSKSYIDSGNIYMRNEFSSKSDFTLLKNGTLGSGHGHCDLGHISIYSDGNPFIVDAGRYTYLENDSLREYLKSAYAHNVCVIDKNPSGIVNGSWDYKYYADCLKNYHRKKEEIDYCEASYITDVDGKLAIVTRKVVYINVGIWMLITHVRCDGEHMVENYYNFDSSVNLKRSGNDIEAENSSSLKFCFDNSCNLRIKNSIISKKYNELSKSKKVIIKKVFSNKTEVCDLILKNCIVSVTDVKLRACDDNCIVNDGRYIAKKFDLSENESYIVISFNKETYSGRKLYYYENTPIYGKLVVIHKLKDEYKTIVLRS